MSTAAEKKVNARFRALMDRDVLHLRVGQRAQDATDIRVVGNVWELHGTACTCCERRQS